VSTAVFYSDFVMLLKQKGAKFKIKYYLSHLL